jgi:hypothetical protein
MQSETKEVLVSLVAGEIRLTIKGEPAETIEVYNGDSVRWRPEHSTTSLALLFPQADKPVKNPVYFGEPGEPITITMEGTLNKHYRYSVIVFRDLPYTQRKPGELEVKEGDYPPKFTVDVEADDPVVIIR